MQTVARSNFTTVKTEGGILPAELLQRIADGEVDGLNPTDYHLAASERLNEAINRSWNRLLGVWQAFQHKMEQAAPSETGTTMTRDWLLTLLQELGYGRLPYQGKLTIGDTDYPISHLYDHTPIHLVTFQQKLDSPDRSQAVKRSPHSLLQECLNRSDTYLWGFVSNGLRLRILRDNISLTRVAYVEFDLEAMFQGELYADFTLLWLLCHQSRVEVGEAAVREQRAEDEAEPLPAARPLLPSDCWLERWSQKAAEQGTRALDALRDGVQEAIAALGRGFLAHPANHQLKDNLRNGALTTQDYYRQLLRLVYRLLFLFVAEDRDLLLLPGTLPSVRQQYDAYYSVSRLRRLAETRRGGPHPDLYHTLARLSVLLRTGYEPLGLPGLGSFLFSERATLDLDTAQITNQDLLTAVRALAFTVEGKVRRPVDYKNLGPEELGSVYESLLELHPKMHVPSASFSLDVAAGSERKTTGSYYTPTSLIQSLLDSALEPVVADRLQQAERGLRRYGDEWQTACEKALLDIKVVDPAAGSGHFLIAAARRLARHLARVRTGDDEPGPDAVRHALRDVVGHCIHGVDINEMAVELCKVSLWMETLDPGRPLSFLDRKIRPGNSLIGATPALLHDGIPDDAFNPITGDDKSYCNEWKKQNKAQQNQETLFSADLRPWQRLQQVATDMRQVDRLDDNTLTGVQQQEATFYELRQSPDYLDSKLWADAWCAAFVWIKAYDTFEYPITEDVFRRIGSSSDSTPAWLKREIDRLSREYQFFHWHLEFPQVFQPKDDLGDPGDVTGWEGGFDVVLGNPPWEKLTIQEKEWFATREPEIANAPNATARQNKIKVLKRESPDLYAAFLHDKAVSENESKFLRVSGRYPLCGRGDINTFQVFAELCRNIQNAEGRVGIVLPTGIATGYHTQFFFQDLVENASLVSLYSFENEEFIFPAVHHSTKFCLLTITGKNRPAQFIDFVFFARQVTHLNDPARHFTLSPSEIILLNPNTRTCPVFRSREDATLTTKVYKSVDVLKNQGTGNNAWDIEILRMFDMAIDSGRFHDEPSDGLVPLYEAKMISQYDHRFGTYENATEAHLNVGNLPQLTAEMHNRPDCSVLPHYWVAKSDVLERVERKWDKNWFLVIRRITSSHSERTIIACVIPFVGSGHNSPVLILKPSDATSISLFLSLMNSVPFDYIARQKLSGTTLNNFVIEQLPFFAPEDYSEATKSFIRPRVLELSYTSWNMRSFANDMGYIGPPFRWDEYRRAFIRAELDAYYAKLFGFTRHELTYILDPETSHGINYPSETFRVLKENENKVFGYYRTQHLVLEIYDEMAEATQSGKPYQTRLDPPPAHPDAAHPWDKAYLGPELPRDQWWREIEVEIGEQKNKEEKKKLYASEQAAGRVVKKTAPTFELKRPPAPQPKPKAKPTPSPAVQPTLITDFSPPKGSRAQRLRTVMGLGQPKNQAELQVLVGALADEDDSIRWLAGSSLTRLGGLAVVNMLAAFLQSRPGETARQEAVKVLELIADTDGDEKVQDSARKAMQSD